MTSENKAPERIWATEDKENFGEDSFHSTFPMRGLTEYVRADLYAAQVAEIARLTAERDAAMAGAVKVKPLVWAPYDARTRHYNGPTGRLVHTRATCAGLDYSLEREEHPASEFYGKWFVMRGLTLRLAGPFQTDISAKDWCQADCEARIRAALQPDPDARQADLAKEKAKSARLVDAAVYLRDDMLVRAECGIDVIHGEQYRVVNAGNGAWAGFIDAIAAYEVKT